MILSEMKGIKALDSGIYTYWIKYTNFPNAQLGLVANLDNQISAATPYLESKVGCDR